MGAQFTMNKGRAMLNPARACLAAALALALAGCAGGPGGSNPGADLSLSNRMAAEANDHYRAKRYEKSADAARKAVNANPSNPAGWNTLGLASMELNQNLGAAEAFQRAAEASPKDPRPFQNLGMLYLRVGWAEQALRAYAAALERDPNSLEALRGAVESARLLNREDRTTLDHLTRLTLLETDDAFRKSYQLRRLRIEQQLQEQSKEN
jgi:tetratricopeptide (TPR) repeat protein